VEKTVTVDTAAAAISPGARRAKLYRERRRDHMTVITVELRPSEIDALVRSGLLDSERRGS
jgi:hypothetical protein